MQLFTTFATCFFLSPSSRSDASSSQQSPFSIVTALVDRIDISGHLDATQDIKMMGHVTWVGKSSAESSLDLYQGRETVGLGWRLYYCISRPI